MSYADKSITRGPVVRTRTDDGSYTGNDLCGVCPYPFICSRSCRRFPGNKRHFLGRIWPFSGCAVSIESVPYGLRTPVQRQSLAVFTAATVLWGFGWLFYMGVADIQVCRHWESFYLWLGMRGCISNFELAYIGNGFSGLAETGGGGSVVSAIERLLEILAAYPNSAATIFGAVIASMWGSIAWYLKRPLQTQAVATERQRGENELFKMQISGFEALVDALQAQIVYLRAQESVQHEYEAELIRQLRECRASYLRATGRFQRDNPC